MRYLILLLLVLPVSYSYSQDKEIPFDTNFWQHDYRFPLFQNKWYLNASQISSFGWNDTSVLVSTVQSRSFIRMQEMMEFGEDRSPNDVRENTFLYYRFYMEDSVYGTIETYDKKRNAKKRIDPAYYDVVYNGYQLSLIANEPVHPAMENLGGIRTYVFSKYRDTLELTTKILGNWKMDSPVNLMTVNSPDTLIFHRTAPTSFENPEETYHFSLGDGYLQCSSPHFMIKVSETKGYTPDPYYTIWMYNYAMDIGKRQLIFEGEDPKIYDILELNEQLLVLKLHQE